MIQAGIEALRDERGLMGVTNVDVIECFTAMIKAADNWEIMKRKNLEKEDYYG